MTPSPDKLFDDEPVPTTQPPAKKPPTEAERLYAAYPKKKDRGHAIIAIRKALKRNTFEVLLRATRKFYATEWPKRGTPDWQYVPYPATWYNGEGWLDETAPDKPKATTMPNMPTDSQRARRRAKEAAEWAAEQREQDGAEAHAKTLGDGERTAAMALILAGEPNPLVRRRYQTYPPAMDRAIWRMHQENTNER